jgi:hypothetical protein
MAKVQTSNLNKGAAPGGKKLFPTGKTLVKVTFAERTVSRTGNERLTLTYEGTVGDSQGMKTRDDFYYNVPAAEWKTALVTQSLGVDEFDPDNAEDLLKTFVGKKMMIVVSEDEYTRADGDVRMGRKISGYESLVPAVANAQREERAKRFGNAGSGAANSASTSSRADRASDDVPF